MNAATDNAAPTPDATRWSTRRFWENRPLGTLFILAAWLLVWLTLNAPVPNPPSRLLTEPTPAAFRAYLPFLVGLAALGILLAGSRQADGVLRLFVPWLLYGVTGILSGVLLGPTPGQSLYWGLSYLCPLLLLSTYPLIAPRGTTPQHLLRLQWGIIVALAFLYLAVSIWTLCNWFIS